MSLRLLRYLLTISDFDILLAHCCSEGDKDAAPAVCSEKGLGRSRQLHLWTEGWLQSAVPGTEGCYVSSRKQIHTATWQTPPHLGFVPVQVESAALQHQPNAVQELAVLSVAAAPGQSGFFQDEYPAWPAAVQQAATHPHLWVTPGRMAAVQIRRIKSVMFFWSFRKAADDLAGEAREGRRVHEGHTLSEFMSSKQCAIIYVKCT